MANIELRFPMSVTPAQALSFHRDHAELHDLLMVMAADWHTNPEPGEEGWFEELTSDEFQDEDFLSDFADARMQLWLRPERPQALRNLQSMQSQSPDAMSLSCEEPTERDPSH